MSADDRDRVGEQEDWEPREQAARERMAAGAVVREMGIRWCSEHGPHERCHYNDKYDKAVAILAPLLAGKREAEASARRWEQDALQKLNDYKCAMIDKELVLAQLASANARAEKAENLLARIVVAWDDDAECLEDIEAARLLVVDRLPTDSRHEAALPEARILGGKDTRMAKETEAWAESRETEPKR